MKKLIADLSLKKIGGDDIIIPDQLFGAEYGGKFRFFALGADHKTETIVSTKAIAKSFAAKLRRYEHDLDHQTFRDVWGIPNTHGHGSHRVGRSHAQHDQSGGWPLEL